MFASVFLALHLPYLPSSLEDLDSINFALGMRKFDVAQHQPHPPGYPVYILAANIAHTVVPSDARALAILSVVSAALGVVALAALYQRIAPDGGVQLAIMATALAVGSPLYWFTAVRPLSDSVGLAAAVAVQALTLAAVTPRVLAAAAFLAGLAAGIRSQVLWLTVPLLLWKAFVARPFQGRGRAAESDRGPERAALPIVSFAGGVLAWFVPLVVLTGGPAMYWRALFSQGAEDFTGVRMLWTTPTPRMLVDVLYYAFIAPWAVWATGIAVLVSAAIGIVMLARRNRQALTILAIAFGPYLLFDMVFQEAATGRYALPIVVPVAFLAAAGLSALPKYATVVAATALVMFNAHVGGRSIAAYSRQSAPVFRLMADMKAAADASPVKPVLAPDRRQSLDLRRPLVYLGDQRPAFDRQLPAPAQHEWLEPVKYWNAGGRAPVWFVVDPRRAAIDLVQHGEPAEYGWHLPYPVLLNGVRPNDAALYRVDGPDWYVGEGWALTPESAGIAAADRREPSIGPIEGWIHQRVFGGTMMIGGRNFSPEPATLRLERESRDLIAPFDVPAGFFLKMVRLPAAGSPSPEYTQLRVHVSDGRRVAIEQFDASASRGVVGFGAGWHEKEFNPVTGLQWRWLSERGELQYVAAAGSNLLRIAGESPRRYYSKPSRMVIRRGDTVLHDALFSDDFTILVNVPAADEVSTLLIETDQIHVPAERSWRGSADRRHLGLRIFECELRPASSQDTTASFPPAR